MRNILWAVAALLFSSNVALAQDAPTADMPAQVADAAAKVNKKQTPEERATKMAAKLTKKLSLSGDQQKEVFAAFLNQFQQVEALRAKRDLKGKVGTIRQETDAKLKTILGDAKYAQYQAMRNDGQAKRAMMGK